MLYLIKAAYLDENDNPKKCLKIGFTENLESRMFHYGTSNNPNTVLLLTRDGDVILEKLFHYYYKDKILPIKGNREWMEFDEKIIDDFKTITERELFVFNSTNSTEKIFREVIYDYFLNSNQLSVFYDWWVKENNLSNFIASFYFEFNFEELFDSLCGLYSLTENSALNKKSFILEISERLRNQSDVLILEKPKNEFNETYSPTTSSKSCIEILDQLKILYNSTGSFEQKMKAHCLVLLDPNWSNYIHISDFYWLSIRHRNLLNLLGPERIKANGYRETNINKEVDIITKDISQIVQEIRDKFSIGSRYSLKEIKLILGEIYSQNNYNKTPKATDILEIFNARLIKFYDPITKKRDSGYEILGLR